MHETSLTYRAFKNSLYNIIGYFWPMLFTLLITPLIVFKLGVKDYGIYLFISTAVSILGLLDLGLGTAVTKHLSFYYGRKDYQSMNRLSHSANSLFLITAVTGMVLIVLGLVFGNYLFPDKFITYKQYSDLLLLGGIIFFFITINATPWSIVIALQRFDITTKMNMLSTMTTSLGMFSIVLLGGSIREIFILQAIISIAVMLAYSYISRRILPEVKFGLKWNASEIKKCYSFGLVNFINNLATTSLISLDKMIIPFFTSASSLTYYSMPGSIATKIPSMSNSMSISLFPSVSQLSGNEEKERIAVLYKRSFRLITIVSGALTITAISFSYKTLLYWLNADFANNSNEILIILILTNFLLSLFGPLSNFLLGLGKLKFLAYSSISMALLNVLLLLLLLPKYGILGAAWAYLISVLPVLYFFYYVEKKYLDLKERRGHYIKTILGTISVSAITLLINLTMSTFVINLISLLIAGANSVIIYILLYKLLGFFEREDWHDIEKFFQLSKKRIKTILHI